jgi:hypothetical protein
MQLEVEVFLFAGRRTDLQTFVDTSFRIIREQGRMKKCIVQTEK